MAPGTAWKSPKDRESVAREQNTQTIQNLEELDALRSTNDAVPDTIPAVAEMLDHIRSPRNEEGSTVSDLDNDFQSGKCNLKTQPHW
jgi:hypothetical protein